MFEHPFDIIDEAHAQHFISLVQHQGAKTGEIEGALTHVVHHPAGGAHHDLNAAFELMDLVAEISAAVDRQGAYTGKVAGIAVKGICYLQR